jgi:hypothetical protein
MDEQRFGQAQATSEIPVITVKVGAKQNARTEETYKSTDKLQEMPLPPGFLNPQGTPLL